MAVSILSSASSLNPGADLWITPDLENSKMVQKLDWYLNFQTIKAHRHQSKTLSTTVVELLKNCELPDLSISDIKIEQLLIPSDLLLPNRWVLSLSSKSDAKDWVAAAAKCWADLNKPSLRVFLPTGLSSGDFQKLWKQHHSFDDFTIVVD